MELTLEAIRSLDFPYKRLAGREPRELFERLCVGDVVRAVSPGREEAWAYDRVASTSYEFQTREDAYELCDSLADYYTEEARVLARVHGRYTPMEIWQWLRDKEPEHLLQLALERQTLDPSRPPVHHLREVVFDLSWECTQFKVSLARACWSFMLAQQDLEPEMARVLDPCAGWGDRLIGALSLRMGECVCIDPNARLSAGLLRATSELGPSTSVVYHCQPFEDVELEGTFDCVFTSPPFFDYEVYNDARDQSVHRHPSLRAWTKKWLLPQTLRMWRCLRPGGFLALYLSDTSRGSYCERLVRHMEQAGVPLWALVACRRGVEGHPLPLWVWRRA